MNGSSQMLLYNAFTGNTLEADPDNFLSLADLKSWIQEHEGILASHQILLTSRSTQLKLESMSHGQQIFVFDKALFSPTADIDSLVPESKIIPLSIPPVPPSPSPQPASIVIVLNTFIERAHWANAILTLSQHLFDAIECHIIEISVIKQAVDVSLTHLRHHSNGIIKSLESAAAAAKNLTESSTQPPWQSALDMAAKIPVHKSLLAGHSNSTHLSDWIDQKETEAASTNLEKIRTTVATTIDTLYAKADEMFVKVEALEATAKAWFSLPTAPITYDNQTSFNTSWKAYRELTEDIGTIVQKIQSDCSYVSSLPDSLKSIQNSMRIIQLHDREFLSKAQELTKELWSIHKSWALSKTFNTKKSITLLRTVSQIQFFSSPLRQQITTLVATVKSAEADRLVVARAVDMPYLYGALLFELIRRDEWVEQIKARVNRTAEMMAGWREDEIKRRTKWIRQLGGSLGMLKRIGGGGGSSNGPGGASDVPEVEITLINSNEYKSYALERKDLDQYLNLLKSNGLEEEYEELAALVAKTDKINPFPEPVPVEHQKLQQQLLHRKSVFKEGNVSEYSKSLLLSRSMGLDTPINKIEEPPAKTDSSVDLKIQVYEARIRKLEDMLHRNQFRDSWTNKFHAPGAGDSTSMIKVSVTDEQHQALLDKIKLLEEQAQEKDQEITRLTDENKRLYTEIEQKNLGLEEAQIMKSDLMANLSTKESEFNTERRSFQKDIGDLKNKLYELEVEFDREIELSLALEEEAQSYKHQNSLQLAHFKRALKVQKRTSASAERRFLKAQTRYDLLTTRARDLSQRLYTSTIRNSELLESLGMQIRKEIDEEDNCVLSFKIQRVKGLGRRTRSALSANNTAETTEGDRLKIDPTVLYWIDPSPNDLMDDEQDDDDDEDDDTDDIDTSGKPKVPQSATTTQKIIDSGSLISAQSMGNSIVSLQNTELLPQKLDSGLSKVEKTESIDSANTDKDSLESPTKHSSLYSSTYEQRRQLKRQERQKKLQEQQKQNNYKLVEDEQTCLQPATNEKKQETNRQLRLDKYRLQATKQSELRYQRFLNAVYIDYDLFRVSVTKRFSDVEHLARKLQKECRGYRETAHIQELASRGKLAYRSFKQGDLALFLPTRDQTRDPNPWAAFNVGAPHYFLKPIPEHRLFERDWLVARITKVEERVVDRVHGDEKENPFDLGDGLKWHLLEAVEEK